MDCTLRHTPQREASCLPLVTDSCRPRPSDSCLATAGKVSIRAIRILFYGLFFALSRAVYRVYTYFNQPNHRYNTLIQPLPPPRASPPSTGRVYAPITPPPEITHLTGLEEPLPEFRPLPPPTRLQGLEALFESFKRDEIPLAKFETAFASLTEDFTVDYKSENSLRTLVLIEEMKKALARSQDLSWIFSTDEATIASHTRPFIFDNKQLGYYYHNPSNPSVFLIFAETNPNEMRCYLRSNGVENPDPQKIIQPYFLKGPLTKENFHVYLTKDYNFHNPPPFHLFDCLKTTLQRLDQEAGQLAPIYPYLIKQVFSSLDIQRLYFWLTPGGVKDALITSQLAPQFASFTEEDYKSVARVCRNLLEVFSIHRAFECHTDLTLFFDLFSPLLLQSELDVDTAKLILQTKTNHLDLPLFEKCLHICSDSLKNPSFAMKLVTKALDNYGHIPAPLYTYIENLHQESFPWEKVALELINSFVRVDLTPLNLAKNAHLLLHLLNKYPSVWQKTTSRESFIASDPEKKIIQRILAIITDSIKSQYRKEFLETFSENLAIVFFEKGFTLTHPSQVATLHASLPPTSCLHQYLSERKDLFPVEIPSDIQIERLSPTDLIDLLESQKTLLEFETRKSRSDPTRANISLIHKAQQLKKAAKALISKSAAPAELAQAYHSFVRSYDALVDHIPILALLRQISRELRTAIQESDPKKRVFSPKVVKFLTIWDEGRNYQTSYTDTLSHLKQTPGVYKETFLRQKDKVLRLSHEFFTSPFWNTHNRRHLSVHGTKSATLHLLSKTPPDSRALRACGELVKSGTAPFAGELCGSMRGHNAQRLSFSRSTATLEDPSWKNAQGCDGRSLIFCAPTHLLQSIIYALKAMNPFGVSTNYSFDEDAAWNSLEPSNIKGLLRQKDQRGLDFLAITILRLRMINRGDIPARLGNLQQELRDLSQTDNPLLATIFEALTTHIPFQIAPEDIPLVQEALPIVFATFSHFDPNTKVWVRETSLPTDLRLGKEQDIDVVFTTKEHRQHVEKTAAPLGLEVHDIDELLFAEMLTMMEGSQIQQTVDLSTLAPQGVQMAISSSIQDSTLPLYAKPLPREPKAPQEASDLRIGPQTPLQQPFFGPGYQSNHKSYQTAVDRTESPARDIHGVMHMLRASILAQVFQQILANSQEEIISPKDRYLIAMAAAFHDSAREDEAKDRWDELSAWNFREFLIKHNRIKEFSQSHAQPIFEEVLSPEEIQLYYNALAHKDSKEPKHNTRIRQAVHDADCAEIIRCTPDFHKEELCVAQILQPADLDQLIGEIKAFIQATERTDVKLHYEYESQDPYNELVHHLMNGPYPMLQRLFLR